MWALMTEQPFAVYVAGEILPGTGIVTDYIRVTRLVLDEKGRARFTVEEAHSFGHALIAAAEYCQAQRAEEEN